MATTADQVVAPVREVGVKRTIDRWIFVFMAALFVLTALAGFVPSSIGKVMAVQQGLRPPFPGILHVHAVLMGSWLLLLLAQATLMATGRSERHGKLGMLGIGLVPAIVVAGIMLVVETHTQLSHALAAAPPGEARMMIEANTKVASNILLAQIRIGLLFSVLVGWALLVRRKDSGLHKRLMFLGTAVLLPPAFARIDLLPNTMPESYLAQDIYTLLWVSPMFLWDLYRLRRVHSAYVVWLAAVLPASAIVHWLWGSDRWLELARRIVGLG